MEKGNAVINVLLIFMTLDMANVIMWDISVDFKKVALYFIKLMISFHVIMKVTCHIIKCQGNIMSFFIMLIQ